jgi:modulator of FtsH protease HflK
MSPQDPILPSIPPSAPPPAPAPGPAPPADDAGSQALAEALRSSFFIVKIIMVGLALVFLGSGFFTVGPQERAVVLRLGKPLGEGESALRNPGLHWAFPRPIDEVEHIPFTSVQMAESSLGWFLTPEERAKGVVPTPTGRSLNPATSSYALTADTNIVHVMATLKYRITDPIAFHFDFVNAPAFITNALNNALLLVTSQFSVDDLLTKNRVAFKEQVTERAKALIGAEKLGVAVVQLDVDAWPPLSLKNKFDEVVSASQKSEKARNDAQSYATTIEAKARANAFTRISVADAGRKRLVSMVTAQADTFLKERSQYEHDPAFFEGIRQMTVLEEVYTNAENKWILPPNTHELRLQMSPQPEAPNTNNIISEPY